MAKKLQAVVKLQLPAGKATPGPRGNQYLLGQKFHLRDENPARARSYQEGDRDRVGFG